MAGDALKLAPVEGTANAALGRPEGQADADRRIARLGRRQLRVERRSQLTLRDERPIVRRDRTDTIRLPADGGRYYDVHKIENMRHALTILAYEMNGAPVRVIHGAPLRLRCENELGFKMVKWIASIEFVADFADLGAGQGGYN